MALKQPQRQWYSKIRNVLEDLGFSVSKGDNGSYTAFLKDNHVLIAVYVDEVTIEASALSTMATVKLALTDNFEMTDKGDLLLFSTHQHINAI